MATEAQRTESTTSAPPPPAADAAAPPALPDAGKAAAATAKPTTEAKPAATATTGSADLSEPAAADEVKGNATDKADSDQGKPNAEAAAEIEIKLPDGVNPDVLLMDKFKPLVKELGLKSEGAQKLTDLYVDALKGLHERAQAGMKEQHQQWTKAIAEDKEIGGQNFEASVAIARKALARFGGEELRTALGELGIGSHPALVKAFVRIGKAISEDSVAGTSGGSPAPQSDPEAAFRKMYPTMFPNAKE